MTKRAPQSLLPLLLSLSLAGPAAHAAALADSDLADLSIEQLSNIVITSVSRQDERLSNAAASVFIITGSELRRSGVRSLPEALRLAPNLQVARIDARNYAVTARGFNNAFENKLLVLIDGRSVYSPLFSGVYWDAQDVVMEDVERIEVISGAGATIWGVNAVNGVINVITRSANDTQGGLASVAGGADEKDGTLRYGGKLDNGAHYRLYARYMDVDATTSAAGKDTVTGMRRRQAGFRADMDVLQGGVTMLGNAYQGALGQAGTRDIYISGANLVSRYTRKLPGDADLRVQLVLDHTERNQPANFIERLDTAELEAQHGVRFGRVHSLVWGGGYRHSRDQVTPGGYAFLPGKLNMHWGNLFAQDEIAVTPQFKLTAGLKAEHNNYTGAEYLPSLRAAWMPDAAQLLWASLARTVRAPSRIDRDWYVPGTPIIIAGQPRFVIGGGQQFESEVANVAELGYRAQPSARWSYSGTLFYADYDKLRTMEPLPVLGSEFRNLGQATTRGLELWARWQATPNWRLSGGLTAQNVKLGLKPGSRDSLQAGIFLPNDPRLHWLLRSSHELSDAQQLDLTLRYNGKLPHPVVPSYYEMDVQWLWRVRPDVDVALIAQNLLHARHAEWAAAPNRSVLERSALLKVTWRF
ncbi:TonB-dependent receptor plug domain-containing protein [Pseudoduganella aquatica]|uniref:TonB-dependent receptor n=1 Tax=Pseudoduganella aquatica TaxID=2660641 RepID=A0A7X4KNW7_9BURK|nr:TonB-dependent receptor [Pseudoduganella aquatica]MYN09673.1 TonB-dependent receptor [Pseudoduganella aquatica]